MVRFPAMAAALLSHGWSLATTFRWLPDQLDVPDAMVLGAGVGAAFGGAVGLTTANRANATQIAAAAAIVFLVVATLVVIIGIAVGKPHGVVGP